MKNSFKRWEVFFSAADIHKAIKPINFLCRVLGLSALSPKCHLSRILLAHSTFILLFAGLTTAYVWYRLPCSRIYCKFKGATYIGYVVTNCSLWLSVVCEVFQKNKWLKMYKMIKNIDNRLIQLGLKMPYSTKFLIKIACLILFMVLLTAVRLAFVFLRISRLSSFVAGTITGIYILYMYLAASHILTFPHIVGQHFDYLTKNLLQLKGTTYNERTVSKVVHLSNLKNDLHSLCDLIEATLCKQVFLLVPGLFFNITFFMSATVGNLLGIASIPDNATAMKLQIVTLVIHTTSWIYILVELVTTFYGCQRKVRNQRFHHSTRTATEA